jgi:hypothetical protein
MKKVIFLSIILVFSGINLLAQRTKDVLYLKNGSVINGTIIGLSDSIVKIRTADKSVFVFKPVEVDKYTKEIPVFEGRRKKGLGFTLESGFLMGDQQSENPLPFSFNCLINYTLATRNIISLGSGVEFIGRSYSPVYIEYKRLFFDRKTTPFIFCRGGALTHLAKDQESSNSTYPQYNIQTNYKGGISLTAGTGISWSNEYNETYLSFAYRYFATSYTELDYLQHKSTFNNYYNRLEIKFGFKF